MDEPQPDPVVTPTPGCEAGSETRITGKVTFPNGELPVSKALVYVPSGTAEAVTRSGECGECIDGSALFAHTETAPDGSFELTGVPAGATELVIEKGKFRRIANIDVEACTDNAILGDLIRLPRNSREGDIPRIAVIEGIFDRMEDVLLKLGLDSDSFDIFSDYSADAQSIMIDSTFVGRYDILFVNCGADVVEDYSLYSEESLITLPAVHANIRQFVESGGRLYVTDLAYDLIEATMPDYIDFYGSATMDGLSANMESLGSAEVGEATDSVNATIHDEGLAEWLETTGATPTLGLMEVRSLLPGWAVMEDVDAERSRTWVSGDVTFDSSHTGEKPLTATFENGCGRSLYTSYHTAESDLFGYDEPSDSTELIAQEQALAYMILEIGSCIEDPVLF